MISPIAQGLFHRSILMSGSALSDWALNYNPQGITMQVAKKLNCPIEDTKLGECLRNKSYQEIMNVTVTAAEFLTIYGPIVDGLVVPSDPNQVMADSDSFGKFDLLFGMTEIESYNILGRDSIHSGLQQIDRDHNIRRYLVNRFDKRPEVAFLSTLKEYTNTFFKPNKPVSPLDHRDMLLEILSDARVTAPMSKNFDLFSNLLTFIFISSSNWNLFVSFEPKMLHVRLRTQFRSRRTRNNLAFNPWGRFAFRVWSTSRSLRALSIFLQCWWAFVVRSCNEIFHELCKDRQAYSSLDGSIQ